MIIMIIVMMIIIAITRQYHYRNHYNHCHYFITTNNFKCSSEVAEIQNVFQYSNNSQYVRTRTTRICLYYEYSKCNLYYCSVQENLHPILLVHAGNLLESSKIVLGFFQNNLENSEFGRTLFFTGGGKITMTSSPFFSHRKM